MSLHSVKLEIVQKILSIENPKILNQILSLMRSEKEDFWKKITREEKKEILQGLDDLESGQRLSYESVLKKHRK